MKKRLLALLLTGTLLAQSGLALAAEIDVGEVSDETTEEEIVVTEDPVDESEVEVEAEEIETNEAEEDGISEKETDRSESSQEIVLDEELKEIPSATQEAAELLDIVIEEAQQCTPKTVNSENIPSFEVYNADARINGLEGSGNSVYDIMMGTEMVYQQLAEYAMEEEGLYYSSGLWLTYFDSIFEVCPQYAYEGILMAYLDFDASSTETKNTLQESMIDFTVDLVGTMLDQTGKTADDWNELAKSMSVDEAADLISKSDLDTAKDLLNGVKLYADNAEDLIDSLAGIAAFDQKRKSQIAFLKEVRSHVTDNDPLITALDDIIGIYSDVDAINLWIETDRKIGFALGKQLVSMSWEKILEAAEKVGQPTVSVVLGNIKLGASGLNVLFGTKALSKDLMSILTVYIIDKVFQDSLKEKREAFLSAPTDLNATMFNDAFDSYLEYQIYADQVAKQYVYDIINSGLLTKTFAQIFYSENIETAEELQSICDSQMRNRKKIASFVEDYYQIYCKKYGLDTVFEAVQGNDASEPVAVTGISFGEETRTLPLNNQKNDFGEITIEPSNATNQNYTVTSSDPQILLVDNIYRELQTKAVGTVTLTVTSDDGGFTDTQTVTVVDKSDINSQNFVATGTCGKNLKWTLDDEGLLRITGTGPMTDWQTFSAVPWYAKRGKIKKIIISSGVTTIEDYAFYDCVKLANIMISNSVTNVGNYAFYGCNALSTIIIPYSVEKIGNYAYCNCDSLETIEIQDGLLNLEEGAFRGCSKLKKIFIPKSVTKIKNTVFENCLALESIAVDTQNIHYSSEDGVLYNKDQTTLVKCPAGISGEFVIPDSVTSIGAYAFESCSLLTKISIPKSVTSIHDGAFRGCLGLTGISIPDSVTMIDSYSLFKNCSNLESVSFPEGITKIDSSCFGECKSLKEVWIPSTVSEIADYSFDGVEKLSIHISDLAAWCKISYSIGFGRPFTLPPYQLYINDDLATDITIPETVTSISQCAFLKCTSLTSVNIPENVIKVGAAAFESCSSLKTVSISAKTTSINNESFVMCHNLERIEIDPDNPTYCSDDGVWYNKDKTELIYYPEARATVYEIPEGVINIGSRAFEYCSLLEKVTIPHSVKTIGTWAFYDCYALKNIELKCRRPTVTSNQYNITCAFESVTATAYYPSFWTSVPSSTAWRYSHGNLTWESWDPECTHEWDDGTVIKEATCTEEGSKTVTCSIGGETKTVTIDKLGHKYGDWTVTTKPTCTAKGEETRVCSNDSSHKETREADALGHNWNDGTITKRATCEEDGIKTFSCTNEDCTETRTEPINKLGHKYGDWKVTTEATCTAKGVETRVCANDSSHKETRSIDALGHSWDSGKVTKAATCGAAGVKTFTCSRCKTTKTEAIPATGSHTYKTTTTKAKPGANGKTVSKCSVCGTVKSTTTIYAPKTLTLSTTSYTYNGKTKTPTVTVKDSKGNTISSTHYTVSYASGRKYVGKYKVTVNFNSTSSKYSGTLSAYFNINPKGTTLKTPTAGSKSFTAKWTKQSTQTSGYQLQYSTSSKFTNAKTVTVTSNKTISKKITKLTAKKKYYVRIRTYKTVSGTKYYSAWSSTKTVTTKK